MPADGLLLRACEFVDLRQVTEVEKASFPERPYSRLDFAYYLLLARGGFIVASQEGKVVGYVIAVSQRRAASIPSIAVLPGFRGRGIGEALLRSALAHLAGRADTVSLLVASDNPAAIGLYKKLSFEETGRTIRGYYPNGSDALEMARRL